MKAYTSINYIDLSLEEVEKLSKRIFHIEGRNNGLLYNGKIILSVPIDGNEFTIDGYLKAFPDIVNCKDDLNKAFLKRNYVYREFLNLMMNDRNFRITYKKDLSDPTDYISFTVQNQPKMLINNAFDWSNSINITRGQWYDLHNEWCRLCTILMKKFQ